MLNLHKYQRRHGLFGNAWRVPVGFNLVMSPTNLSPGFGEIWQVFTLTFEIQKRSRVLVEFNLESGYP